MRESRQFWLLTAFRTAMVDFWQARMPKWQPLHWCTDSATTVFYFSKYNQGPGIGCCFASRGGPGFERGCNCWHFWNLSTMLTDSLRILIKGSNLDAGSRSKYPCLVGLFLIWLVYNTDRFLRRYDFWLESFKNKIIWTFYLLMK